MKRLSLFVATLLCTFCICAAGTAAAENIPEAQELALNTACEVSNAPGQESFVRFTAGSAGIYRFVTDDEYTMLISVREESDGEPYELFTDYNETVDFPLQAGETRFFGIQYADEDHGGDFTATIEMRGPLYELNENETCHAVIGDNQPAYFMFVPEENGAYSLVSMSEEPSYGTIYKLTDGRLSNPSEIVGSGGYGSCLVDFLAKAGEKIYLSTRFPDDSEGELDVAVETCDKLVSRIAGSWDVFQTYGQSSILTVEASSGQGELTWTWLKWENGLYVPVENADGNSMTVPADLTEETQYTCIVSDGVEENWQVFQVFPRDSLWNAYALNNWNPTVQPGDSIDLSVAANSDSNLHTYQWYQEKQTDSDNPVSYFEPVPGAVNDTYHVENVEKTIRYFCRVSIPLNNEFRDVSFLINVPYDMNVFAESEQNLTVAAGSSATMKVRAETESNLITYQWFKENGNGYWEVIDGEEEAAYTASNIQRYTRFGCSVDNGYEELSWIEFTVSIENNICAWAAETNGGNISVNPGDACLMTVETSSNDPNSSFNYQWYGPVNTENEEGAEIPGAADNMLNVSGIQHNAVYYCVVTDQYAFSDKVYFYIHVSNNWSVEASTDQWQYIMIADPAELAVNVNGNAGESFTYQWYGPLFEGQVETEEDMIEGADSAVYYLSQWTSPQDCYVCVVKDKYGNSQRVPFFVAISENLEAHAKDDDTWITAGYGQEVTLTVEAESYGRITYNWYKLAPINDYVSEWLPINDEYKMELTTEPITYTASYMCIVMDEIGTERTIEFQVFVDNELQITLNGDTEQYFRADEPASLSVNASCIGGEISYQWYGEIRDNYGNRSFQAMEGETGPSLAVTRHEFNGRGFYCQATDSTGDTVTTDPCYIWVDNGFYAEADESNITVKPGESTILTVNTTAYDNEIVYLWYRNEILIPDATENSFTIENADESVNYRCYAYDKYGNGENIYFSVSIDNGFTASAAEEFLEVVPGQNAAMTVNASCDDGSTINYQWYRYDDWYGGIAVEGATGADYISEALTTNTDFYCTVRDQYGNSTDVWFRVSINNHLSINADETSLRVAPNETATMTVHASCEVGNITYQWYEIGAVEDEDGNWAEAWLPFEGANSAAYTSEPITQMTTYQCNVRDEYGSSLDMYFNISIENHLTIEAENNNIIIEPNTSATMEVQAHCDVGPITYQWSQYGVIVDENGNERAGLWPISGATEPVYTSEPHSEFTWYRCSVRDEYGNSTSFDFNVCIENHFSAEAVQGDPTVSPNETVPMEVNANCDVGSLIYEWYKYDPYYDEYGNWYEYKRLGDVTGAICISEPITHDNTQYYCDVRDEYGNGGNVWFHIHINNQFTAEAVQENLTVAPNATARMEVNACCDVGNLTYQWYKYVQINDETGNNYWTGVQLDDANEAAYTSDAITGHTQYYCNVQDEFGSGTDIWFNIYVENHLTAEAVQSSQTAELNTSATIEVSAVCDTGTITYQWYQYVYINGNEGDNYWTWQQIEGAEEAVYTSEAITGHSHYRCNVQDEFGNMAEVWFDIFADNHLTAETVNGSLTVEPNSSAAMEVNASCSIGNITYQWYKYDPYSDEYGNWYEYRLIEGATDSTYTSEAITRNTQYYCNVQDEYGSSINIWFNVSIENHLTVEMTQSNYTVVPNETVTLEVSAECDAGNVCYQWYKYDPYTDEDGNWHQDRMIDNATEATYTSEAITEYTQYYCYVQDEYGNVITACFEVAIENNFTAKAVQGNISVKSNETASMAVDAHCDAGGITYEWYHRVMQLDANGNEYEAFVPIEGETGPSYTSPGITKYTQYYCATMDEYGNRESVWFNIYVENHLTAEAVQGSLSVAPGEWAAMEVRAYCDTGDISYQWGIYEPYTDELGNWYDFRQIEGANEAICYSKVVAGNAWYRCNVRDEYGNERYADFNISIDNCLIAKSVQTHVYAAPNQAVTMEVIAQCNVGSISYHWYKFDPYTDEEGNQISFRQIDGATEGTYTVEELTHFSQYRCIAEDEYGNNVTVGFFAYVENHLTAEPAQSQIAVADGETVTMETVAQCDEGGLTYQWYKFDPHTDEEGNINEYREIAGATTAIYTSEEITRYTPYYCLVRDEFGNADSASFYVSVENHLTAEAVQENLMVTPGEYATMEVSAACDAGALMYQWYKYAPYTDEYDNLIEYQPIDGATGSAFSSDAFTRPERYQCAVQDQYGNEVFVCFYISMDDQLTAEAVQANLKVLPNETATMEVDAHCSSGIITYQWYQTIYGPDEWGGMYYESRPIEGETEASYTSGAITKYSEYYCQVQDENGNCKYVSFVISVENHLTAEAEQENLITAPDETVTLKVNANCTEGDLTYWWYKYVSFTDEHGNYHEGFKRIEDAADAVFTSEEITGNSQYNCYIQDQYDNGSNVYFYVTIDNQLTVEAVEDHVIAEPHEMATLEVRATCISGSISYQWSLYGPGVDEAGNEAWGYWPIEGATEYTFTRMVTSNANYSCTVHDAYGSEETVFFNISVENHFTAEPVQDNVIIHPGETASLEVLASCDSGTVAYRWWKLEFDHSTGFWSMQPIDPVPDQPVYVTEVLTRYSAYVCDMTDQYGNQIQIKFEVSIDNEFIVRTDQYQSLTICPDETVTMMVDADCNVGPVTFQWYILEYDNTTYWSHYTLIPGATGATLTSEPIKEYTNYLCHTEDPYGNCWDTYFDLAIWNEPTYSWAEDFSSVTAIRTSKGNEMYQEKEKVSTTYQVTVSPTAMEPGLAVYTTANFMMSGFEQQQKERIIPATGEMTSLSLPSQIMEIEEEAFAGGAFQTVLIPDSCKTIGSRAFANCRNLLYVRIPASVTELAEDAFAGSNMAVIEDLRGN